MSARNKLPADSEMVTLTSNTQLEHLPAFRVERCACMARRPQPPPVTQQNRRVGESVASSDGFILCAFAFPPAQVPTHPGGVPEISRG
jgi:hypothetical protein